MSAHHQGTLAPHHPSVSTTMAHITVNAPMLQDQMNRMDAQVCAYYHTMCTWILVRTSIIIIMQILTSVQKTAITAQRMQIVKTYMEDSTASVMKDMMGMECYVKVSNLMCKIRERMSYLYYVQFQAE